MTIPTVTVPVDMNCSKCGARSGDDWEQCGGRCPMPGSPHYSAAPAPEGGTVEAMRRDMAAIGHAIRMLTDEIGRIPEKGRDPVTINNLKYYASQIADWSGRYTALATREEAPAEAGKRSIWSDARNVFVRHAEAFTKAERYEEASAIADKAAREIEAIAVAVDGQKNGPLVDALFEHFQKVYGFDSNEAWESSGEIISIINSAQPPAREDAQPVAWLETNRTNGERRATVRQPSDTPTMRKRWTYTPLYTHPAPDALRVAVEALWPRIVAMEDFLNEPQRRAVNEPIEVCDYRHDAYRVWTPLCQALAALQAEQGAK